MTPTRRDLLLAGATVGAGGCIYLILGAFGSEPEPRLIDVSSLLLRPAGVRAIADAYKSQFAEGVDLQALERRVLRLGDGERPAAGEVHRRLAQLIQRDFANGRVFLFRGWILSRTEGVLCALASA